MSALTHIHMYSMWGYCEDHIELLEVKENTFVYQKIILIEVMECQNIIVIETVHIGPHEVNI